MAQEVLSPRAVRQTRPEQSRDPAQPGNRHAIELRHARMRQVTIVAAEQLVAAVTREHDRHVAARDFRYIPGRNRRGIRERLVEVRDEPIENRESVGPDHELVVIGAEVSRDRPGMLQFVERRFVEANRERLDRTRRCARHQADDGGRVHAT